MSMTASHSRTNSSWSAVKGIFPLDIPVRPYPALEGPWMGRVSDPATRTSSRARSPRAAAMRGASSQPHLPAGQILHDFLGAAADGVDLDLAIDTLNLDAAHVAGAAKDLHRLRGAERHGLRGLVLHHADFGDGVFAPFEPPRQ